ncbi:hypothetical protein SFRURICE_001471 [Spodoptera frugiperda]|nr:hypothetical protein SFRURICE_001471 [Spodoptera frugiperda]
MSRTDRDISKMIPCPGPVRDPRAEQCAMYDRRPFRGDSPCTLNCRPRGQQFYASLALVVDGTPCTKPGFRAICVQGDCKGAFMYRVLSPNFLPRAGNKPASIGIYFTLYAHCTCKTRTV